MRRMMPKRGMSEGRKERMFEPVKKMKTLTRTQGQERGKKMNESE